MLRRPAAFALALLFAAGIAPAREQQAETFRIRARRGKESREVVWKAKETAVIICDMWDTHSCFGAADRVAKMAPKMDAFVKAARRKGALIIHAPGDTMKFYEGTPQRRRAEEAPAAKAPMAFRWRKRDPKTEEALPIDSSDWCFCTPKCDIRGRVKNGRPWKRQIATIAIEDEDAVSDRGREIWNLMEQRGIRNVFMTGVHTNMCVLGRPYGIRQLRMVGKNLVIVRDLTDCLYNPAKAPKVSHDEGTQLVVRHIEKYWCASILSGDVAGKPAEE